MKLLFGKGKGRFTDDNTYLLAKCFSDQTFHKYDCKTNTVETIHKPDSHPKLAFQSTPFPILFIGRLMFSFATKPIYLLIRLRLLHRLNKESNTFRIVRLSYMVAPGTVCQLSGRLPVQVYTFLCRYSIVTQVCMRFTLLITVSHVHFACYKRVYSYGPNQSAPAQQCCSW